jgi:hypothetical protein
MGTAMLTHDTLPELSNTNRYDPAIWVGHTKHGRNYLDKLPKEPDTEKQIRCLQHYYAKRFCRKDRYLLRWVYCQTPVVQIGQMKTVMFASIYTNASVLTSSRQLLLVGKNRYIPVKSISRSSSERTR